MFRHKMGGMAIIITIALVHLQSPNMAHAQVSGW